MPRELGRPALRARVSLGLDGCPTLTTFNNYLSRVSREEPGQNRSEGHIPSTGWERSNSTERTQIAGIYGHRPPKRRKFTYEGGETTDGRVSHAPLPPLQ